jgi:hypothetical protein
MPKKSFALSTNNWEALRLIKDQLNTECGKVTSWQKAFDHIISFYKKGGGYCGEQMDSKGKNLAKSILAIPKLPSVPKSPKSPPKPLKPPQIHSKKSKGMVLPKINIAIPTLKGNKPPAGKKGKDYSVDEDFDLGIPAAPKKKPIILKIDNKKLQDLAKKETKATKFILIECQICGSEPIMMPVPQKLVLDAKEPVVDVTFIHGDPEHVVVAQLDHDFQVRRRRASWIVYEKDFQ